MCFFHSYPAGVDDRKLAIIEKQIIENGTNRTVHDVKEVHMGGYSGGYKHVTINMLVPPKRLLSK